MYKIILLSLLLAPPVVFAAEDHDIGLTAHDMFDTRIPLGLSAPVRHRLLVNMRAQMYAVRAMIGLLAEQKSAKAARIARSGLGLNDEMRQIYDLSNNDDFRRLGLAFHSSATRLESALQSGDMKESLRTLHGTMGFCVQCHRKFRL